MRKITDTEIIDDLKKVFDANKKIPTIKEWKTLTLGHVSLDAILRAFGTWKKAWHAAGLLEIGEPTYIAKEKIIIDLQKAFIEIKDTGEAFGVDDLIRKSGHCRPTIMKYFGSVFNLFSIAKIDLNNRISKKDLIEDFVQVYSSLGKIPTANDIENHCKHAKSTFLRMFGSMDNLIAAAGLQKPVVPQRVSDDDLLVELRRLHTTLGHTPTTEDVRVHSKYSINSYERAFSSFSDALTKIGLTTPTSKKLNQVCSVCGATTVSMLSHMEHNHPVEFKRQEMLVVELYRSGLSARKICERDDHIFVSATSVSRTVNKYTSAEERETLRKNKIVSTLKKDHSEGKYDWVNEINSNRNTTTEARQKNSEGIKKAYAEGTRQCWNEGLTKETDERIAESAKHTSESMKRLFCAGEIDKKVGPESSRWVENRGEVARRYRLGLDFNAVERANIKKRANYCCQHCGISQEQLEENGQTLECDHILAITHGGLRNWETNGQALCPACHLNKTTTDEEAVSITTVEIIQ